MQLDISEIMTIIKKPGFTLYQYLKEDGSFDYEKYVAVQTSGNIRKLSDVWVKENTIAFLAKYLQHNISSLKMGICHGTRNGNEQRWFRKYLPGCNVIGTEISTTASQFPYTIQWDFHETKPEWLGQIDFIYSNSFDHAYDPERALNNWINCLQPNGLCIIEHSSDHSTTGASELDPFGVDLNEFQLLINKWGEDKYHIKETISSPTANIRKEFDYVMLIIIQRNKL